MRRERAKRGRSVAPTGPSLVVGLGASAGGLAPLEAFFDHLHGPTGMAFLVVSHQSPTQPSFLAEILAKHTDLKVVAVEDRAPLAADHVYLAMPGRQLAIQGRTVRSTTIGSPAHGLTIDALFRSLANECGDRAVAIVFSGTGTDGTRGLAEVKGSGGLVLAQAPATAEHPGMPSSAIATGLVDLVLPPEELASRLLELRDEGDGAGRRSPPARGGDALEELLRAALPLIHHHTGRDLSAYKKPTLLRRLARRLAIHRIRDPAEYAALLRRTPHEIDVLLREMLIGVTSFFRDPEAFAALKVALLEVVRAKEDGHPLRIWVPGCSTGEEAYSIAILARECMKEAGKHLATQIFATDIDPHAIEVARVGRYPGGVADDVDPSRLTTFFTREDNGFRVDKSTRELLVFAVQDMTTDPPFTRLDLVACRNVMIYLEPLLQKRVLALFHYALKPGGLLFLGASESVGALPTAFAAIDKEARIYRQKAGVNAIPAIGFGPLPTAANGGATVRGAVGPRVAELVRDYLVREYAPLSAVVVNEQGDIVYVHGKTGAYLEPSPGEPKHNVFAMAREGLGAVVHTAVRAAIADREKVVRHEARVKADGGFASIVVTARAITTTPALRGLYLVVFEPDAAVRGPAGPVAARARRGRGVTPAPKLEEELRITRENLEGVIQQLQHSNDDLQSANEELRSTNEELQSANEELETSREELQSLNEELQTLNAELESKMDALSEANDDMQNLLNGTDIATLFLDGDLAIKRFTPAAKRIFHFIDGDVGRPIADLSAAIRYAGLVDDAREVLRTLVFCEREVETTDGAWRAMRILPYRTSDNAIDGLVLTFTDIDRVKKAEAAAQRERAFAESIVDTVREGLVVLDAKLRVISANRAFYASFSLTPAQVEGRPLFEVGAGEWSSPSLRSVLGEIVKSDRPFEGLEVAFSTDPTKRVLSGRRLHRDGEPDLVLLVIEEADGLRRTPFKA
jgi:two-component system CheB/CheR fusion protein